MAYAEPKITVLPDAHADTAVRFVDTTEYLLPLGGTLTWFNVVCSVIRYAYPVGR
jgi:hypothetical protein